MRNIKSGMLNKVAAVALSAVIATGTTLAPAFAATNGSVGATSSGSATVTAFVGALVRVTAVDDLALGTWTGVGSLATADNVCIWTTTGGYNVTASGDGGGGSDFALSNGASGSLAYTVKWDDTASSSTLTTMTTGTALTGQVSGANSTDCNAGANLSATVAVEIAEADLTAADSGSYSGVLTLVIAPE
jgi:hypothetical protein